MVPIADAGPYPYTSPMTATLIGYARCDRQDLAAQRQAHRELVVADRIYTDHGLTGTTAPALLDQPSSVRQGDTPVVPKRALKVRRMPSPIRFRNAA